MYLRPPRRLKNYGRSPSLARQMGANGRRFVEQHFDPRKISEGIRAVLLRVYQKTLP